MPTVGETNFTLLCRDPFRTLTSFLTLFPPFFFCSCRFAFVWMASDLKRSGYSPGAQLMRLAAGSIYLVFALFYISTAAHFDSPRFAVVNSPTMCSRTPLSYGEWVPLFSSSYSQVYWCFLFSFFRLQMQERARKRENYPALLFFSRNASSMFNNSIYFILISFSSTPIFASLRRTFPCPQNITTIQTLLRCGVAVPRLLKMVQITGGKKRKRKTTWNGGKRVRLEITPTLPAVVCYFHLLEPCRTPPNEVCPLDGEAAKIRASKKLCSFRSINA